MHGLVEYVFNAQIIDCLDVLSDVSSPKPSSQRLCVVRDGERGWVWTKD